VVSHNSPIVISICRRCIAANTDSAIPISPHSPCPMMTARVIPSMMTARVITTILRLPKLIHPYIVVMTLAVIMGGATLIMGGDYTGCLNYASYFVGEATLFSLFVLLSLPVLFSPVEVGLLSLVVLVPLSVLSAALSFPFLWA